MKADFRHFLKVAIDQLGGLTTIEDPDFRLEQAVYNEDSKTWEIVVSYLIKEPRQQSIIPDLKLYFPLTTRTYKKLIIGEDFEPKGFLMYENTK